MKEAAGKYTGDAKLEAEGKADKLAGKVQNAVGGLKDTLRGNSQCEQVPLADRIGGIFENRSDRAAV